MDFVPIIDRVGEPATGALLGLVLGLCFGFAAERSGFCTRSAVIEAAEGRIAKMIPTWIIGFAVALAGVQALIYYGQLSVIETRFFSTAQSLSGALIGGGLFGIGMILSRGCASRLVVLGSTGNFRAIFSVFVFAIVAWFTYQGPLTGVRDFFGGLISTSAIGGNDLVSLSGFGSAAGPAIGGAVLVAAIFLARRGQAGLWQMAGGLAVGLVILSGWYFSYSLSTQVFEPIQAESLSYMRPAANTINFVASGGSPSYLSMDVGIIAGTVAGALIASLLFGSFKFRSFGEAGSPSIIRYATGSALMGFGGILAVGCTIGAGLTGGSVLAVNSLTALAAMVTFAALAHRVFDQERSVPKFVPAE